MNDPPDRERSSPASRSAREDELHPDAPCALPDTKPTGPSSPTSLTPQTSRRVDAPEVESTVHQAFTSPHAPETRSQNTTLQSVTQPGPPTSSSWDERRVIYLEQQVDQLNAFCRLHDKKLRILEKQQRWTLFLLCAVALSSLVGWLL